jgi:hypothetical protein
MKITDETVAAAMNAFNDNPNVYIEVRFTSDMRRAIEAAMQAAWVSVDDELPPQDVYVLARAPSGYSGTKWRYTEARYDKSYGNSWRTSSNDPVVDFGEEVTHWMLMPEYKGE